MKRLIFAAAAALAVCAFVSCGNESPSNPPPAGLDASTPVDASTPGPDAGTPDAGPQPTDVTLENFTAYMADHVCSALFRCCDPLSLEQFFDAYRYDTKLGAYVDQLPCTGTSTQQGACTAVKTITEPECRRLIKEMNGIVQYADWITEATAGNVQFVAAEAKACGQALDNAACGEGVTNALRDSTCFAKAPPQGGDEQRRVFKRTKKEGDSCTQIRDGFGAGFFGTCDPQVAFCCFPAQGQPEGYCGFPTASAAGKCRKVSAPTESCSQGLLPFQLCRTGLVCDSCTDKCVELPSTPLATGETCMDGCNNELGVCTNGWCDTESAAKTCQGLKANGQTCQYGFECMTGNCASGKCADPSFCVGK